MASKYRITVTKQTLLELHSENEAKQVADMFISRETSVPSFGGVCLVTSEYELVSP